MQNSKLLIRSQVLFVVLFTLLGGCRSPGNTFESRHRLGENEARQGYSNPGHFAEFSKQPRQIALLLPLSGINADSAKAIREGFFASYYQSTTLKRSKPNIRIYDTAADQNIQQLYHTALREGADFIVGPLAKEDVQVLSQLGNQITTPVLALNHHPDVRNAPRHFLQFSLAPETEAEQIAEQAWQQGHRSASIIVPDNAWGKRTANAFTNKWRHKGGRVLHTVYAPATQDQSASVRKLLGIDQSQTRASQVKALLTEKVEFQPRRRQDVDIIVMAASPDQARQLKPLFDFYYAEDVPVYATSSIYSGYPNPKKDRDMNGIIFCDMPWLLDNLRNNEIKQLLNNNANIQSDQYNRLFAMGVDAYQLSNRLNILQGNTAYPGATGNLYLSTDNQVQRKLTWAKIIDGVPMPL